MHIVRERGGSEGCDEHVQTLLRPWVGDAPDDPRAGRHRPAVPHRGACGGVWRRGRKDRIPDHAKAILGIPSRRAASSATAALFATMASAARVVIRSSIRSGHGSVAL